jgi:two-component system response regulator AtoC
MYALVIDDDDQVRSFLHTVLHEAGWEVTEASSAERAFGLLHEQDWSLVLCDVLLGDANGFSVLRRFKEELPDTQVVLMTGHGTALGALDATAFGAYDYLLKPFGVDELLSLLQALGERHLNRACGRVIKKKGAVGDYTSDIDLIGRSEAFIQVMKQVGRVASTNLPVLITGESGTGKEVVASALHRRSQRASKPFVAVNCGAIPAELIESELFGHVKGAFTGAHSDRAGLWEEADGGTVFLDEITESAPAFQVKLLRVLQEGEIRRVGSNLSQQMDVRVIAASNRDVEKEIIAGRFRRDLFYRLNAVSIHLPPLRDRREDIFPLANSFAERVWSLNRAASFSPEALRLLERYSWPGNIRELENAVVRAVALCGGVVRPEDLPEPVRRYQVSSNEDEVQHDADSADPQNERWLTLAEVEADYVKRVLEHTKGNKQAAVRLLNVDRKTVERMIQRYDIKIEHDVKIK